MLRKLEELKGFGIRAVDGDIGTVHDAYFEDDSWHLRYLVVNTGGWLSGKQVLITPLSVEGIDDEEKVVRLTLTREQIEGSPSIATDQPVSRQFEQTYFDYYGYPYYWYGYGAYPYGWGGYVSPSALARSTAMATATRTDPRAQLQGDPHLRSVREVKGYHIQATDESIGNVEDFVLDDETWQIRYLIVDTSDWWFGKHVVLPPDWIKEVSWIERKVFVNVSREEVKSSPEFDKDAMLNREYEERLYGHYDKRPYWS